LANFKRSSEATGKFPMAMRIRGLVVVISPSDFWFSNRMILHRAVDGRLLPLTTIDHA
jgi:hypothetical protein